MSQSNKLKATSTIQRALRDLERAKAALDPYDRAFDQIFGAIEALRWILGDGPPLRELAKPLGRCIDLAITGCQESER